jgi:hypothetical protein
MKRMLLLALAVLIGTSLAGCTVSEQDARSTLQAQGFTEIELGGNSWFACDDKDTFTRTFKAKSIAGQRVEGAVCAGWFKGNTIRTTRVL